MENKCDSKWYCAYKYIKWGMGFFVFGLLVGFGVLIHYLNGSDYPTTTDFLSNITLWFGSPLVLSSGYLQVGGLAMAIVGVIKLIKAKCCCGNGCGSCGNTTSGHVHTSNCPPNCGSGSTYYAEGSYRHRSSVSLILCVVGLIALFIVGWIGYFIIDAIWPGFYYAPIDAGKNLWLILQGLSLLCFWFGILGAICHCCKRKHYS